MAPLRPIWSPLVSGLSLSGLELWLIDRVAFEVSYLRDLEIVEPWNKNTNYGSLVQAGIEGFIKTRQARGAAKLIQNEFEKQVRKYEDYEDIAWWSSLAQHQVSAWIDLYAADLDNYGITKSEVQHKIDLTLPSGRPIVLNGYIDGEGDNIIVENKVRGDYDPEAIAKEIDMNLQINLYLLMFRAKHGRLPDYVWSQHIRRPSGFGYRGPAKRAKETRDEFKLRLADHIHAEKDYHFFRYMMRPDIDRHERFLHACLYPMLEAFLDWYEYMIHPDRKNQVNRTHWMTPYGLYNPFMEGTQERFRTYRIEGTTLGLRPKVSYR